MGVEAPRKFLAPLTAETINHPHIIVEHQTVNDFENDERQFICKTSLGERWKLTIPISQLIYPNRTIYDYTAVDEILKNRLIKDPHKLKPDQFQLGQDHGLNFASNLGIWNYLTDFVSTNEEGDSTSIWYPPLTYIEIAMNGSGDAERMDFAGFLKNGAILTGEFSTLEPTLSRKHKQIREYTRKMKELLLEAGIDCDLIPFYIQCGYEKELEEYTLKFRRVKKDPQSDNYMEPF